MRLITVILACSTTTAFQPSSSPPSQRRVLKSSALNPTVGFESTASERYTVPRSIATALQPRMPQPRMSFDLASTYITALNEHYYQTTVLQSLVLVSIGDVLAQALEGNGDEHPGMSFDWRRTLRMGMLGTVIGGLGTATWLRFLEAQLPIIEAHAGASFLDLPLGLYEPILRTFETFGPEHGFGLDAVTDSLLVAVKATLDACVWAPIANTLYLVLTPLSEGESLSSVGESLGENFFPVMKSELKTFFPYNLLAFAFIPPLVRPFTTGVISMCFSTYISWITHLAPKSQLVSVGGPPMRPESTLLSMAADASAVLTSMDSIDAARGVVAAMDRIDATAGMAGASMSNGGISKPRRKPSFFVRSTPPSMAADASAVLTSMDSIDAARGVVAAMDRIDTSMKGPGIWSKPRRKKGFLVS